MKSERIFALKKTRASGRNVGKVFNPVVKLVLENQPFLMPEPAEKPSLLHFLCYAILNWKPSPHTKPNTTYGRQLKNLDVPAFLHDLQSLPWSIMDIFDDPSDILEIFNHFF